MSTSAGILLFRRSDGMPEVLLIHPGGPFWVRKDLGAWSIPKGEMEEGEDGPACALREMREELGPAPEVERDSMMELGFVRQKGGKVVHAWAVEGDFDTAALQSNTFTLEWPPRSGNSQQFPEADRAEWFSPDEAKRRINPAQATFIDRLLSALASS